MAIRVKNTNPASAETFNVAINEWGSGGETGYFPVTPGKTESWDRTDVRGFVMSVQEGGLTIPYFVAAGDNITLSLDASGNIVAKDDRRVLKPARN